MTKYYGIGTWWGNCKPHQKFDKFINEEKAYIHALPNKLTQRENNNRIRFQDIFKTIEVKDVIYLKSFNRRGYLLRIRAVGKVIKIDKVRENEGIFCVKVDYKPNHDINGIIDDIHFGDIKRDERIYQETNQELIHIINELLHE